MRKILFLGIMVFLTVATMAQSAVTLHGFVPCGSSDAGTQGSVSFSLSQTFNAHSAGSVPAVAQGLQQGYSVLAYDTLILLASEMGTYTPGDNIVLQNTPEGYDETRHRQVYQVNCQGDFDYTMTTSGVPTYSYTLAEPEVLPANSLEPAGPVAMSLDRSNPYDYPVGVTTTPTWTLSVAGETRTCNPNVTINYYPCEALHDPVFDIDGFSYPVIRLGYYCWTGKNARTEHYDDGTDVPNVMTFPREYATNIRDVVGTFGHLYNWEAATNYNVETTPRRRQGICPTGWHIPNEIEAGYLMNNFEPSSLMSNDQVASWIPQNGTDDYAFTFLPAGYYNADALRFEGIFVKAYYWTIEEDGTTIAHACEFGSACSTSEYIPGNKLNGYSVRCVLNY